MADVESCSFSRTSVTPTVILSLLDFEPLVFDLSRTPPAQRQARRKREPGFQEVPQWEEEDDQHDGIGKVESTNNTFRASSDGAQRDDHLFNNRKSKTTATTRGTHASYADNENGQHHPKPFFCSKGKSCIFTANPSGLSRALQTQSALTFLVASKLSQRQVRIQRYLVHIAGGHLLACFGGLASHMGRCFAPCITLPFDRNDMTIEALREAT